jgi:hypothetical protein
MNPFSGLELEVDRSSRMTIMHPTTNMPLRDKDGCDAWIELYSNDSTIARRHERAIRQRRLSMRIPGKITADEIEASAVELLAALTRDWRLLDLSGVPIDQPFSIEAARQLYSNPALLWLREQVDAFVSDRANFSKASSTNSETSPSTTSGKVGEQATGPR